MISAGHGDDSPVPDPAAPARAEEGEATERAISEALSHLDGIHERPVAEHVERFEAVHRALTDALNKAENLLSSSNGNGS